MTLLGNEIDGGKGAADKRGATTTTTTPAASADERRSAQASGERGTVRRSHARLGAACSVVVAGTLVMGLCGGSFASVGALAYAETDGVASAASPATDQAIPEANDVQKDEVVYARLSAAGAVDDVYVVNVLDPQAAGEVVDFGPYTSVVNLTDASGISLDDDAVIVDVQGNSLSYQGNMGAAALPWDISVTYELDGAHVDASELGGASGLLSITVTTTRNTSVDAAFFDNYLLQITVPLSADTATDIATEDGQIALAGSDTQVTFTGMPGKDGSFTMTAQVSDFSFAGISFAAVPFSMGIDTPDTGELVSGFRQLGDGVGQLKDGVESVADGAGSLASGAGQIAEGVDGIAGGVGSLSTGAGQLAGGAQGVADGASGLAGGLTTFQQQLAAQAIDAQGKVDQATADAAAIAYQNASSAYMQAYLTAYNTQLAIDNETNLAQGMDSVTALQAAMQTAAQAAAVDSSVAAAQTALQNTLSVMVAVNAANAGYGASAQALSGAAVGMGSTSDAQSLIGGASSLAAGAQSLAAGTGDLSSGAASLASGADQAASGAGQVASGASDLSSGAQQLADGTDTLYTEVQAMPDKVQQEIDAMMADYDKSDFTPVSFASPKNTNVQLVQFVMTTDAIEAPIAEEPVAEEPEQGIWERILALFGL